jgi:hypothetical protein
MIDERLSRWIKQSFLKELVPILTATYPMFIEGEYRDTNQVPNFYEFRLDGPFIKVLHKNNYFIEVELNILIQAAIANDMYIVERMSGPVITNLDRDFEILKHADGEAFVFCMSPKSGPREALKQSNFGQPDVILKFQQTSIEAHYVGYYEGV